MWIDSINKEFWLLNKEVLCVDKDAPQIVLRIIIEKYRTIS